MTQNGFGHFRWNHSTMIFLVWNMDATILVCMEYIFNIFVRITFINRLQCDNYSDNFVWYFGEV